MIETEYQVLDNCWTATYKPTLQRGYGKTESAAKENLIWWIGKVGILPPYFKGSAHDLKRGRRNG